MTDRHQHLAAGRPVGQRSSPRAWSRTGSTRELVGNVSIRVLPDRASRHLGGAGPRRAAAGDPGRDDAPRGLRAHRRQAAGRHPDDRRQAARADRAADHRRARGVPGRRSPSCSRCARAGMEQMVNHGTGWVRMEYLVPARGLIGFRTEFLTETRGTGHAAPRLRGLRALGRRACAPAPTGSLVADRAGAATGFALTNLQERGTMFVGPTTEVYEGMIVGENSRADDMDVNPTKEKKLTNMRSVHRRRAGAADPAPRAARSSRRSSSAATTSASRSPRTPCGCARSCCPRRTARSSARAKRGQQ